MRLAPRPVFLVGREELLTELDTRLTGGEGRGPQFVGLWGLAGAGKTPVPRGPDAITKCGSEPKFTPISGAKSLDDTHFMQKQDQRKWWLMYS